MMVTPKASSVDPGLMGEDDRVWLSALARARCTTQPIGLSLNSPVRSPGELCSALKCVVSDSGMGGVRDCSRTTAPTTVGDIG